MQKREIKTILTEDQIARTVKSLAKRISSDYKNRFPLVIGVLNAAFVFLADLSRHVQPMHDIGFVQCRSYKQGHKEATIIDLHKDVTRKLENRNVILVDTIFDTGETLKTLKQNIKELGAFSVSSCVLLRRWENDDKRFVPEYIGCDFFGKDFLIGYGLDWEGYFRGLSSIITVDSYKHKISVLEEVMRI